MSVYANSGPQSEAEETTSHVCIVGAGIAGASAAHFLSLSKRVPRLTVFEKSDKVGGRIQSLAIPNHDLATVEAGATIISSANLLMRHFASYLNLSTNAKADHAKFSLWNGTHVTMSTSEIPFVTIARLLARYHMSPIWSKRKTKRLLKLFDNIYPRNITNYDCTGYTTVPLLFARTGLFNLTQTSFSDAIAGELSTRFSEEIVSAITRVNYGQNVVEMNALAGNIALAGSGSELWSVKGGNVQIPFGLLESSGADVLLRRRVTHIMRRERGGYIVKSLNQNSEEDQLHCDAVIMAAPVELNHMSLPDDIAGEMHVEREFQQTVATFIEGDLRKKFGDSVSSVLTTEGVDAGFTSIGLIKRAENSEGKPTFWKVFSRERMNDATIANLFEVGWKIRKVVPWMAYPKFRVPESFAPFDVDPVGRAFFYTSPIESVGSAMETSAIAGANAAALVRLRLDLGPETTSSQCKIDLTSPAKTEL